MDKLFRALRTALAILIFANPIALARVQHPGGASVMVSVIVEATPERCWDAIRNPSSSLDHRRVISSGPENVIVEETFNDLPILHSATCVFVETEIPLKEISFKLKHSDKFKSMSGAYRLSARPDGTTVVELESNLDIGPIPFTGKLAQSINEAKCRERLMRIKAIAESNQTHPVVASAVTQ